MTYQIRGPHIIGAILAAALFSLPLDWQVVEAVRMDVRMERAARAAEEREARRERDRAFANATCGLLQGCVHADGPERRGNQGVTLGRDRGFEHRPRTEVGAQGVSPDGAGELRAEGRSATGRRVMHKASASHPPRSLYTVTAYSHRCALPRDGRERAPRPAANGEWPVPGLTLAADWTLHPPGSVLIVGGRRWRVTDRGYDIRGRRLDLFLGTCAEARIYGRRVVPVGVEVND